MKKNIAVLEQHLSEEQTRHAAEMDKLSSNLKAKLESMQAQQKRTIGDLEESRANEISVLNSRVEKAERDREQANRKLQEYVEMYKNLEKYFKNPVEGSICRERGESNLYEVLEKVQESTINIF